MKFTSSTLFLVALVALFIACQQTPKTTTSTENQPTTLAQPAAPVAQKITGLYSLQPAASILRDCDSGKTYWVEDKTNSLERLYQENLLQPSYPGEPVFVMLDGTLGPKAAEGHAAKYDGVFSVQKIDSIETLNFLNSCESYDFWCSGTEPFWNLQIFPPEGGGSMVFREAGGEKALIVPAVKPSVSGNTWTYNSKNEAGESIIAVVKKEPASDGMSEMEYNYSCRITIGKQKLSGVAIRYGEKLKEPN